MSLSNEHSGVANACYSIALGRLGKEGLGHPGTLAANLAKEKEGLRWSRAVFVLRIKRSSCLPPADS